LEKKFGIKKSAGKVRKVIFFYNHFNFEVAAKKSAGKVRKVIFFYNHFNFEVAAKKFDNLKTSLIMTFVAPRTSKISLMISGLFLRFSMISKFDPSS
jgi:lauroyl/myristoyl acyltransferase